MIGGEEEGGDTQARAEGVPWTAPALPEAGHEVRSTVVACGKGGTGKGGITAAGSVGGAPRPGFSLPQGMPSPRAIEPQHTPLSPPCGAALNSPGRSAGRSKSLRDMCCMGTNLGCSWSTCPALQPNPHLGLVLEGLLGGRSGRCGTRQGATLLLRCREAGGAERHGRLHSASTSGNTGHAHSWRGGLAGGAGGSCR